MLRDRSGIVEVAKVNLTGQMASSVIMKYMELNRDWEWKEFTFVIINNIFAMHQ